MVAAIGVVEVVVEVLVEGAEVVTRVPRRWVHLPAERTLVILMVTFYRLLPVLYRPVMVTDSLGIPVTHRQLSPLTAQLLTGRPTKECKTRNNIHSQ